MDNKRWFGTDGIRGRFGSDSVNPEFGVRLGYISGAVLSEHYSHIHTKLRLQDVLQGVPVRNALIPDEAEDLPTSSGKREATPLRQSIVIGRDTRISGPALEHALAAGFAARGLEVYLVGVAATPLIAFLTRQLGAIAGVVVSASHNPYQDNGIKFFNGYGFKISDAIEEDIENRLNQTASYCPLDYQSAAGSVTQLPASVSEDYQNQCVALFSKEKPLTGLKIVVDCAHGAFYQWAPRILKQLGADVFAVGVTPDGRNINQECGAVYPQTLRTMVLTHGADVGIAFDGDGDRVVMVDHQGVVCDGDVLLYILACHPRPGQTISGVVGTFMTNLGLEQALQAKQIAFQRADVGDRYVFNRLRQNSWQLGGENSGHIIDLGISTTGDGLLAGLSVLRVMCEEGKTLAELAAPVQLCHQVLTNISYQGTFDMNHPVVVSAQDEVESLLQGQGRLLLRLSGTEPLVRIMVEANDRQLIDRATQIMVGAVKAAIDQEVS